MTEAKPSSSQEKSKSRPTKTAGKSARPRKTKGGEVVGMAAEPTVEKSASPYPVFDLSEPPASTLPAPEESVSASDWPEPEIPTSGDAAVRGNLKRKRRRKKGKGGHQNAVHAGSEDALIVSEKEEPAVLSAPAAPVPRHTQPKRPRLDGEIISKLALKIYLAEVSEEGVALIGDNDAKELSRRCFRLAEIFMEEQGRRH